MASARAYKVVLVGDSGVGKTSLVHRCAYGEFAQYPATVGVSNTEISFRVAGRDVVLRVWDTAGQERYSALMPMFARGAAVCVLVAAADSDASFRNLERWRRAVADAANAALVLAVNKCDAADCSAEAVQIAEQFPYAFHTSALTGMGVNELFQCTAQLAASIGGGSIAVPSAVDGSSCC